MNYPDLDAPVSLDHLERMTDCFGLVQHANYSLPDFRTGYTTDDNARALVAAVKHYRLYRQPGALELAERYLSFLMYAQTADGRFHNFIGYTRAPLDEVGSEEAFGRALRALSEVLLYPPRPGLIGPAERMLHDALPRVEELEHPRSRAHSLVAMYLWAQSDRGDVARAHHLARPHADYLMRRYQEHARPGWEWMLPEFTYANALPPEGMFRAYQLLGDNRYLEIAERTLAFLAHLTSVNGTASMVGNREWLAPCPHAVAMYDQQPIEAAAMVDAALAGYEAAGRPRYLRWALRALAWFYGRNVEGLSLYDPETEGCFDALMQGQVNQNRGAESTASLILARLAMAEVKRGLGEQMLSASPPRRPGRYAGAAR